MTLSITQRILCELHTVGAMNEQTGLSGKDIADLLDTKHAPARLVELRKSGYVKSSDRSTGAMRFWLTPAGETYAIELKHYAGESKHDQENNPIENSGLNDATLINEDTSQAIPEGFTPWDGGECPVPTGTLVDVIYRDGRITRNAKALMNMDGFTRDAGHSFWQHDSMIGDIIAYRLSEPATDNVYMSKNSDKLDEKLDIPPPQYNPDDVAFKKSDTVFWYTVDGIKEVFETSSEAIHAAQELVKNRKIVATIHAVASKPHAIIKPVVTTELEYV